VRVPQVEISLVRSFFFSVVAYISVGCAYNIVRLGARFGLEAFPHSEFWRELPELVKDGVKYSNAQVQGLLGRKTAYQTVEDNDYDWG